MAAIIYTDENKKFDFSLMSRINSTKAYINHVENYFYLRFILDKSDNFIEKNQANKEILIAERKMLFWMANSGPQKHLKSLKEKLNRLRASDILESTHANHHIKTGGAGDTIC